MAPHRALRVLLLAAAAECAASQAPPRAMCGNLSHAARRTVAI